ncbi:hypothetical protein [Microbulbifer taiwanensis]|uniref:Uncharacterized protein n=1 Tax=Microbulbifer taiwanensis TaxID=986746 RepID=A0ABW1YQ56_9GAMM|nr:hypothetical protein [Microbulbifer taiwanensis]
MTPEEKEAHVKEHLLNEALESIRHCGRYWNGSISRSLASTLKWLLESSGYPNIYMREIPPDWEHVYYMYEHSDVVEQIAYERSSIKRANFDYSNEELPK